MNPCSTVLLTDLYQLTMVQTYLEQGMEDEAVFELFVRKLNGDRRPASGLPPFRCGPYRRFPR